MSRIVRGCLAMALASLLLAVSACGNGPAGPVRARWVGARGQGGGQQAGDEAGDDPGGPGAPLTPSASASAPSDPHDPLNRIPSFPPAPTPVPITLPAGPDAAFLSRIPTTQKVAFLTIDDGWTKLPEAVALVQKAHLPVTLFLTINAIRDNPAYFKQFQAAGAVIEAHTITHTELKGKPAAFQRHEICDGADQLGHLYGRRPVLFRPPFGDKDETTLRVTRACGMKVAFFWRETVDKGIVRYQVGHSIQPGDIVLMHFRPAFVTDYLAALTAIHDAGLTPALLDDYIPAS